MKVEEAYIACKKLTRQAGTSFYYGMSLLPVVKRQSMYAVYAWSRLCDDAVDEFQGNEANSHLERAEQVLNEALDLNYNQSDDPIVYALGDTIRRFHMSVEPFYDLLKGMYMDVEPPLYRTFDELKLYMQRVAGSIGQLCVEIFGASDPEANQLAIDMGIAFQLTNILRDLKEDIELGRIYLPTEELDEFGYSPDDLKALRRTPSFYELMAFETQRAHHYYERARQLFSMIEKDALRCIKMLYSVYYELLKKIEQDGYEVFERRIRVSTPRKLVLMGESLW